METIMVAFLWKDSMSGNGHAAPVQKLSKNYRKYRLILISGVLRFQKPFHSSRDIANVLFLQPFRSDTNLFTSNTS